MSTFCFHVSFASGEIETFCLLLYSIVVRYGERLSIVTGPKNLCSLPLVIFAIFLLSRPTYLIPVRASGPVSFA